MVVVNVWLAASCLNSLDNLHVSVDITEVLPGATHCFYNLAKSWFLLKSDLKHKQFLLLAFKKLLFLAKWGTAGLTEFSLHVKHTKQLTCITAALFGVVALSREAASMPLPDLLFFPLFLQNELPQTRLDLYIRHVCVFTSSCSANILLSTIYEFYRQIHKVSHKPCWVAPPAAASFSRFLPLLLLWIAVPLLTREVLQMRVRMSHITNIQYIHPQIEEPVLHCFS